MPDPKAVNSMFARIANRYDLANRLLSFGTDVFWRKRLVKSVQQHAPLCILDLATGSGDVAFALAKALPDESKITGMDFCKPMLEQAEVKKMAAPASLAARISFLQGDGMKLPLPDESFDAVTISFGLRNMADRVICLREIQRVLKPGGRLHILEFSRPYRWFSPFYLFYLRRILPLLAGWITGDRNAYVYLNESIESFPSHQVISKECLKAGFSKASGRPMTLGIVALHIAVKQPAV